MINLDQVKLLETKVAKTVDYIERLIKEKAALNKDNADLHKQNADLRDRETELQAKLGTYQKRIDELEVLFKGFKEDQGQIEEAILATLDKLSQFEKAMEKSLRDSTVQPEAKPAAKESVKVKPPQAAVQNSAFAQSSASAQSPAATKASAPVQDDIPDPLEGAAPNDAQSGGGELDIY